ncbi:MAG: hypothetical protein DRJ42_28115 [Deltaproteobacteria bacterium]|nr:MAG: hypothetical protein DRJ42_28115 [Deltaproteobacteria bacterium]
MSDKQYLVRIVEDNTGKVEREMGPMGGGQAIRVMTGAEINLDHERFSVVIADADSEDPKETP